MRWVQALGAAVAATTLVASVAKATLSVSIVKVPTNFATLTADSSDMGGAGVTGNATAVSFAGLNFPRTFDVTVTQSGGEQWTVGTLVASLTKGTFYTPGFAGYTNSDYTPNAGLLPAHPEAGFDTYLSSPVPGNEFIAGKSDINPPVTTGQGTMPGAAGHDSNTTTDGTNKNINVTWGVLSSTQNTVGVTTTVARLTILGLSAGSISNGHITGTQHLNAIPPDVPYTGVTIPLMGDFGSATTTTPDGAVNASDVKGFIAALGDPISYQAATGVDPAWIGDFNDDGAFNATDVAGFIQALGVGAGPLPAGDLAALEALVPEPTSLALIGVGLAALAGRRRRA